MNHSVKPKVASLPTNVAHAMSMGQILMEEGKLTLNQLEDVLRLQRESRMRFGEAAISLGIVTESDIKKVIARQFHYAYLQPDEGAYEPELVAAYHPFSAQCEVLRTVRSELMLRWFGVGNKELAVISTGSQEGASFFTANLAIVFSQIGATTLLVDANLRCPVQHDIFNLTGWYGFSDILAGRATLEAISNITHFPDLYVMPAGTLPPNPLELLSRDSFEELSASLRSRFDVILYDTPEYFTTTDSLAIASHAKGALLLAQKNSARLSSITAASKQLIRNRIEIVGSVLVGN